MRQFLKIGLGGSAALALVITFALGRTPSPAQDQKAFEAWAARLADDPEPLKKADQIRVVSTERIMVEPIVKEVAVQTKVPPIIQTDDDKGEKPKKRIHHRTRVADAGGNVCTRHGKRKVTTHGGRSWRCR